MSTYSQKDIAEQLEVVGIKNKTVAVHSQLSSIGSVEPAVVGELELSMGMKPFAKTVIEAFLEALGHNGTLFVPTHTVNTMSHYGLGRAKVEKDKIIDDGYFRAESTPSTVGSFTQSVLADSRSARSLHPTHSVAAIGAESDYLIKGHDHLAQPVGITNAFAKIVGLDGVVLFIGEVLGSNTSFHAYETLLLPGLSDYFPGVAAAVVNGTKRLIRQSWVPHFHRDFYSEHKRPSRAWKRIKEAGLLHSAPLGDGRMYWFEAKKTARFFANEVFPDEPDILFCDSSEKCNNLHDCKTTVAWIEELYKNNGQWLSDKIIKGMNSDFVALTKEGIKRV